MLSISLRENGGFDKDMNMDMNMIQQQTISIVNQLLDVSLLSTNQIFIIGCSTSRVTGYKIGKHSSEQVAKCIFEATYPILKHKGIHLAVQCCEHLNRAIVLEGIAAKQYGFEQVNVIPKINAGGALAAYAYEHMSEAVIVEYIKADAGMDIGGTMIGMHLKPVVVPIHFEKNEIGQANVISARTRSKYIGGARANYRQDEN